MEIFHEYDRMEDKSFTRIILLRTHSFADRPSFADAAASSFADVVASSFVDAAALSIASFYQLDGTLGVVVDSADQD